jgi:hypothetical protein
VNVVRCDSCGAPRSRATCDYCGSVYHWAPVNDDWADDLNTMSAMWRGDVTTASLYGGVVPMMPNRRMPPGARYYKYDNLR